MFYSGLPRSRWTSKELKVVANEDMLVIRYSENVHLERSEKVTDLGWWTDGELVVAEKN